MRPAALPLLALALLAGCASASTDGAASGERRTSNLPLFTATDLAGETFRLGDHLGSDVILMSFWATWCEPCKAEMPVLQDLHRRYSKDGLAVVTVSLDGPETISNVRPYIRRNGYDFRVIIDEDTTIAQAYNPSAAAPFSLIISREGAITRRIEGFQPSEAPLIEAELRRLLGLEPAR